MRTIILQRMRKVKSNDFSKSEVSEVVFAFERQKSIKGEPNYSTVDSVVQDKGELREVHENAGFLHWIN